MPDALRQLVSSLTIGISRARMYALDHQLLEEDAGRLGEAIERLAEGRAVEVMVVAEELVINNVLFRNAGIHGGKLVRFLRAKGISRIDFLPGVTRDELNRFLGDVADADRELGTYARIRAGIVQVRYSTHGLLSHLDLTDFNQEQIARLQAVYGMVSPYRELETAGLEEIVANFLLTFRRGANILKMISPVKTYSEYTYTHAMNVAVLSMSLSEYLGLPEALVQEVGIAALMHDVGKLFVSKEVLHKPGALTPEEFTEIKSHPLLGAAYLVTVENLPRLAPVVALEHHRRFDCSGYPPPTDSFRRQHIASQIVTIADFFDALRSTRPYRKSLTVQEVLHMMQKGSGKDFNPALLTDFVMMLVNAL